MIDFDSELSVALEAAKDNLDDIVRLIIKAQDSKFVQVKPELINLAEDMRLMSERITKL